MYDDDKLLPLCQTDCINDFQRWKKIISGCLQLAEESVELRKENETLALLKHRRRQQQENLDLKKLIHASLIQNMNDSPQVNDRDSLATRFILFTYSAPACANND